MDSDDDYLYDATDSGNDSPEEEESDGGMQEEVGALLSKGVRQY